MNTDSEERLMIAELERIIRAEEAKPEAERDLTLIDDCIKEIAEIKGVKAEFSEEEVAEITDKLIQTAEKTKERKRFVRLVAGIAAMFVIVTGVTACAVNPALINWFKMIVRMPFGAFVEQDKVTYTHQGSSEEFASIEELLRVKELNVYYPSILPDGIKINGIEVVDENGISIISFMFTTTNFRFTIQIECPDFVWDQEIVSEIEANGIHCNIYYRHGYYVAYTKIDNNTYMIQSQNINDIILVVGGLRKV